MAVGEALKILAAVLGGGGLVKLGDRIFTRRIDSAAADEKEANARATEVDVIRTVLDEVRAESAKKDARLDALEGRVEKLEERERHALTRAAVHEAWDQLAFAALVKGDPNYAPPPPIREDGPPWPPPLPPATP